MHDAFHAFDGMATTAALTLGVLAVLCAAGLAALLCALTRRLW